MSLLFLFSSKQDGATMNSKIVLNPKGSCQRLKEVALTAFCKVIYYKLEAYDTDRTVDFVRPTPKLFGFLSV